MRDIEKVQAARRRWYYRNATKAKQKVVERRWALRKWFKEYKLRQHCVRCGFDDGRAIHFHHRDPTTKICNPSRMHNKGWSIARQLEELAKCDPLCANCHAIEHHP